MKTAATIAIAAVGGAALYSWLSPHETPEHELMRVRNRRRDSDDEPHQDLHVASTQHVLRVSDARVAQKIDADGGPLVLWLELPDERPYQVRKTHGSALVRAISERRENGAHWFGFEFRRDGDAKLTVTCHGRYVTHFSVTAKNVGRGAR